MTKFEYKFEMIYDQPPFQGTDGADEKLNKLGDEGWELVAVSQCGKNNSYLGYWFKRPKNSK